MPDRRPPAPETIRSRQNPKVAEARRIAHDPREARRAGLLLADGVTLVLEALRAGLAPRIVLADPDDAAAFAPVRAEATLRRAPLVPASRKVLEAISTLATPQGAVGIFARPSHELAPLLAAAAHAGPPLVAILHGLQDPANAGSLARTALAAGLAGIVTTAGTVDPFHPRAVRASMGAVFRLPIATDADAAPLFATLARSGYRRVALDPRGNVPLESIRLDRATAVLLGREGSGLDAEAEAACEERVRIAMANGVESLGVAVAGAILFYSLARSRGALS
ncbi:MAG: TrmH family RNA methyltransferase [Candidatus Eisenbacteria bacterium]